MPEIPDRAAGDMFLRPDETAPSRARHALGDAAVGVPPEVIDRAGLLISEAVTNSVRHGSRDVDDVIRVSIDVDHARIHIDVADAAPLDEPLRPEGPNGREGGFGLLLIDRVADRWGATPFGEGKAVWFEVDLPRS